jgi:ParB family chromosome partitioning protein
MLLIVDAVTLLASSSIKQWQRRAWMNRTEDKALEERQKYNRARWARDNPPGAVPPVHPVTLTDLDIVIVGIDDVMPDPEQPRKDFDEVGLQALADSLQAHGLVQPIVVRPNGKKPLLLIAGERRWRAAKRLGWENIPVIVRKGIPASEAQLLQLLENIVRRDLNPVEEAMAYKKLLDEGHDIETVAGSVGKPRALITYRVDAVRSLVPTGRDLLAKGSIGWATAKALSKLSPDGQLIVIHRLSTTKLSIDQVEALCNQMYGEENQLEMMTEAKVTPEQRQVARNFAQAFDGVSKLLLRLNDIEEAQPGALRAALAAEKGVVVAQLDEMSKALYRVKKAMETNETLNGGS